MEDINKDEPIIPVPPPWKLKGTVYILSFWTSKTHGEERPPAIAYSPLEAESSFADPTASGEHLGGLSQIQIIRYTESPVGSYDELIICPGYFACEKADNKGKTKKTKNVRITRIYVSQKYTCWNGRANWNIPKHLARFAWDESRDGKMRVTVSPYDAAMPSDGSHSPAPDLGQGQKYFFQATFQPMRWTPSFPLSLSWLKYVGIDASLVQPPLPDGRQKDSSAGEELIGTSRWCKILPVMSTRKATLGWLDMSQQSHNPTVDDRDDNHNSSGESKAEYENFWPGLRRWNVAIKMDNADIIFEEGLYWDHPGVRT